MEMSNMYKGDKLCSPTAEGGAFCPRVAQVRRGGGTGASLLVPRWRGWRISLACSLSLSISLSVSLSFSLCRSRYLAIPLSRPLLPLPGTFRPLVRSPHRLIGQRPENRVVKPTVLPTVGRRGLGGVLRKIRS